MLLESNIYAFAQKGLFHSFPKFSLTKTDEKVTICKFVDLLSQIAFLR